LAGFAVVGALSLAPSAAIAQAPAPKEASERAGNGNDKALAIQQLAERNPGLSPVEILEKAFQESEGRIPEMNFKPCDQAQQTAELLGSRANKAYMNFPFEADAEFLFAFGSVIITRQCIDAGPLLGSRNFALTADFRAFNTRPQGATQYNNGGPASITPAGLAVSLTENLGDLEVRQYNEKILIYKITPNRDKWYCYLKNGGSYVRLTPKDGVCAIGYMWTHD
jgi:hypothetical protein